MKHFKLTEETKINRSGIKIYRIEATVDFKSVKKGEKGGWIEKESNLSSGAWVFGEAEVCGGARVYDGAQVFGKAQVYGKARVYGEAWVFGEAWVYDGAQVCGKARVYGGAEVCGEAICTTKCLTLNYIYNLTLTDNHIRYGCTQKTIQEWRDWLDSNEEIETKRNTDKFRIIEMALNLSIEYRKQNPINKY